MKGNRNLIIFDDIARYDFLFVVRRLNNKDQIVGLAMVCEKCGLYTRIIYIVKK